jgi:F0F1-type ATP synthase membrane subunit b/b'
MRNDVIIISLILVAFFVLIIYYDHKLVGKMFSESKARINKMYDSAKAFLFIHFVDSTTTDDNDIDEIN